MTQSDCAPVAAETSSRVRTPGRHSSSVWSVGVSSGTKRRAYVRVLKLRVALERESG
jgi:hypothetical protein